MPAKLKPSADDGLVSPVILLAVRGLLAAVFAVACYLAYVSLSGGSVAGCGPESDCDKVLRSRWAYWLGVPVSLLALPLYGVMFAGTGRLRRAAPVARQRQAWSVLVPCAVVVLGAALWVTGLQLFVIKSFCKFCLAAHGGGFAASLLLLLAAPFGSAPDKPWQIEKEVFIPPRLWKYFALAAGAGLALLVAGQTLHERKTFRVALAPGAAGPAATSAPPRAPAAPLLAAPTNPVSANVRPSPPVAPVPPPVVPPPPAVPAPPTNAVAPIAASTNGMKRPLLIYGGQFAVDVHAVPLIGPANARQVMVSLFDYTCHHCRIMHERLLEVQRAFSNDLAIVNLPMPLDAKCNYTMKRTPAAHTNACDYARLGLAVWRANRAVAPAFDEWVFAPEQPPPLEQARAHAAQLAGPAALEAAARDPWVEAQLQQSVAIYDTAYRAGQGSMPQLIIGLKVAVGTMAVGDVRNLLAEQLGLKGP